MKKKCVAMLLAGGQGSRLGVLTKAVAKPAVLFGGKYRLIDFSLSNCYHSNIDTVGVLTQYQPLELNSYIATGSAWSLDNVSGGVTILPPYQNRYGASWYRGTADAIFQNISFLQSYNPEHVLIISGDHIYKMDYSEMLRNHIENDADLTIGGLIVEAEEASRFGIMSTDDENRITDFEEKPKNPKGNLASMGIYIFKWSELKRLLKEDGVKDDSQHDFGKNIIPTALAEQLGVFAFPFNGYWRDVGTIESFYDAQMELLMKNPPLNLFDKDFRIYSNFESLPPHFISRNASVTDCLISDGCLVHGEVTHSILSGGVIVEKGALVEDSIILKNVRIGKNAKIRHAILDEGVVIPADKEIGFANQAIQLIGKEDHDA
ncbi:glucose-1-phosphate adenylyltransferase [Gottschalkiaceae bacterium SANA]|nr:glucose-1-phosphate adenylyltransferase [Gottschalkiaceae bacterium SANA]